MTRRKPTQDPCPHCRKQINGNRATHIRSCRPHNKAFAVVDMDGTPRTWSFRHALEVRVLDDRERETAFIEVRRQGDGSLSVGVWIGDDEVLNEPIAGSGTSAKASA